MLRTGAATGEYLIGDEPKKIMAYVPLQLYNEKWVVVISTFLPEVTENLRKNFRLFFLLGILILSAILTFGISLYYMNTKRIRAEESGRQLEKLQTLQHQLNHASKLASIGELIDTVAHEINTPTSIITAQTDAMLMNLKNQPTHPEELEIIKNQTRRISKYTRSLLNYSRRVPIKLESINLSRLIDECLYLLGHRFRSQKAKITKNYKTNLPSLVFDRGQMEQVIINILNNALDAIGSQGEIEIGIEISQKNADPPQEKNSDTIKLSISDNGKGIQLKDIGHIFEPFYSTKPPSQGTGLGLYISKAIIQRHGGTIEVKSEVGKGTMVLIYLPLNL
jgi:two-component system NtrC family sensor kinase